MSEFRSRSPHVSRHSPHRRDSNTSQNNSSKNNSSISPSRSPNHKPLWRRRREEAEADDYKERISPNRKQSVSPHRERKLSWHEEDDEDQEEWCGRAERAFSGLNRYERKFKRYTPDAMRSRQEQQNEADKENVNISNNKSTTPIRDRSRSPKPVEIEANADVLIRRQKDIDYGKNTVEYQEYLNSVRKNERTNEQPWTPDKYEKMTRRNWDKQTKIWRKQLHYWRDPKPVKELMTPGTSPCPSPHRRTSPERDSNNRSSARQLFQGDMMDDAMDGHGFGLKKEDDEMKRKSNFGGGVDNCDQVSSGVNPILSEAALVSVKNENTMLEDHDDSSRMSYENSEENEQNLPQAFLKRN